jgi:alpha-galactosidase
MQNRAFVPGLSVLVCCFFCSCDDAGTDTDRADATQVDAGDQGAGDAEQGSSGEMDEETNATSDDTTGSDDATVDDDCVDEYPYDDGYTCEEQASWGKCGETWLEGYCQASCGTCGEVFEDPDLSGSRDVFDEYTEKESLAPTPPMGWNSWNKFACEIDENLIRETADAMVESGMADVGYEYINIDDCWSAKERDADGRLVPDPERFPGGMKELADYVHDLGLKLGIYGDRGYSTCGGLPGSYDHEIEDAQTFAEWGIDYLKYDNCDIPAGREEGDELEEDYRIMGEALRQSGRDIVFSVCAWWYHPWMPEVGHLWRTTTDIKDVWSDDHQSVTRLLNWSGGTTERYGAFTDGDYTSGAYPEPGLAEVAGPNAWNDPDMLEVGNGGMTDTEYRSHFSLWSLMAAPLIAGNDLRDMSEDTLAILTNRDVIAINQDPLGAQGRPISESTELEVWTKRLAGGDSHAIILFNRTEEEADISVAWADVGFDGDTAEVYDVWAGEDLGMVTDEFTATVPSHGVVMLRTCSDCEMDEAVAQGDAGATAADAGAAPMNDAGAVSPGTEAGSMAAPPCEGDQCAVAADSDDAG